MSSLVTSHELNIKCGHVCNVCPLIAFTWKVAVAMGFTTFVAVLLQALPKFLFLFAAGV